MSETRLDAAGSFALGGARLCVLSAALASAVGLLCVASCEAGGCAPSGVQRSAAHGGHEHRSDKEARAPRHDACDQCRGPGCTQCSGVTHHDIAIPTADRLDAAREVTRAQLRDMAEQRNSLR